MRDWFIEQLAIYAAYHRDVRNQATHHIGVPLIVFSLLVAMSQLHLIQVGTASVTLATVVLALLLAFYLANVPLIGAIALVIYGVFYSVAARVGEMSSGAVWSTFAIAFSVGWALQFIGHVFERRRPAFTTNLIQVLMAPPFMIAEILFAFGMQRELAAQIQARSVAYGS